MPLMLWFLLESIKDLGFDCWTALLQLMFSHHHIGGDKRWRHKRWRYLCFSSQTDHTNCKFYKLSTSSHTQRETNGYENKITQKQVGSSQYPYILLQNSLLLHLCLQVCTPIVDVGANSTTHHNIPCSDMKTSFKLRFYRFFYLDTAKSRDECLIVRWW